MSLKVKLPNEETENLNFSILLSVRSFKIAIEKKTGIPYELQQVHFSHSPLDDNKSLEDQGVRNSSVVQVQVDMWWKKIVSLSLKGITASLGRRVSVPMQQIGEGNRVFVTLLICATRGFPQGIVSLMSIYKEFDLNTVTKVTGRSLFHAAVTSSSLKCVEELKKYAGLKFEKFLYKKDKSGSSPLDELSSYDSRMLHYLNKFLSSPLTTEQVENKKNIENERENTYTIDQEIEGIIDKKDNNNNNTMTIDIEENVKYNPLLHTLRENTVPTLGRIKEEEKTNTDLKIGNTEHSISTMASLLVEKTDASITIKVGQVKEIKENETNHLPAINKKDMFVPLYSPRPARKTPQTLQLNTPIQITKQPHPPIHEKKRPVAGMLKESNLRKFSAASHPRPPNALLTQPKSPTPIKRHIGVDEGRNLAPQAARRRNQDKHLRSSPTPTSEEKVRRISLVRKSLSPRPVTPTPQDEEPSNNGELVVIEIEKDRINKPWNSWIKAVTVEADTPRATTPELQRKSTTKSSELNDSNESSLRVPNNNGGSTAANRKISFDQWVLCKMQEQQMTGWQRQEQDVVPEGNNESEAKSKLKHGKTFEQWQKETEARKKQESEMKKKQEATVKVTEEQTKTRRRKESSAKYEQWLLEKERISFDKEMKELQTTKRRISTTESKNNARKT